MHLFGYHYDYSLRLLTTTVVISIHLPYFNEHLHLAALSSLTVFFILNHVLYDRVSTTNNNLTQIMYVSRSIAAIHWTIGGAQFLQLPT